MDLPEKGVLAAMSGGVDSSVAACLLQEKGYACMGATMRLFLNGDIGLNPQHPCCSKSREKQIDSCGMPS